MSKGIANITANVGVYFFELASASVHWLGTGNVGPHGLVVSNFNRLLSRYIAGSPSISVVPLLLSVLGAFLSCMEAFEVLRFL